MRSRSTNYRLRPYQEEAEQAVLSEWDKGNQKTLLVLPTGTGKTIVFSAITEDRVEQGDRVLIVAHRDELLTQAADKLYKATGLESALEKAEHTSFGSSARVTVGSVQTLGKMKRLKKFPHDYFQDIIVDEAHHCLSPTYQTMLNYFPDANVLGVTATPDRGDKQDLGNFFDSQAYEYLMVDAVKDGYLCPIRAQMIPLQLDLTDVHTVRGDYDAGEIGNALDPYLDQIADEMLVSCQGRKTLVFLPLIATSQKFCRILNEKGMRAVEVNGESPDRAEVLADFEAGRYDVLCNSMLLTEGWDCPSVDCIVVLRPTKIRSLYVQMVGRGTRTCPGKENLLLLDFLWLTTKHNLCRPSTLIGKDDDEIERIDELVEENGSMDLLDAAANVEEQKVEEARQEALARALSANRNKKRKTIDPLHLTPYIAPMLIDYIPTWKWESDKPTQRQLETIESFGIDTSEITTKGYASNLINKLIERTQNDMATPKQVNALLNSGCTNAADLSFHQAQNYITYLANHHWTSPYGKGHAWTAKIKN